MGVKVNHVQIHLAEPFRSAAAAATFPKAGVPAYDVGADSNRAEFTGPHFHGIKNLVVSEGTVDIVMPAGTTYMYPLHTVARVKAYTTEE
jgi:hypothetical protein